MYDQVVKCQRAGLCLSEHFLICVVLLVQLEYGHYSLRRHHADSWQWGSGIKTHSLGGACIGDTGSDPYSGSRN